jgi:hypothetical protein
LALFNLKMMYWLVVDIAFISSSVGYIFRYSFTNNAKKENSSICSDDNWHDCGSIIGSTCNDSINELISKMPEQKWDLVA